MNNIPGQWPRSSIMTNDGNLTPKVVLNADPALNSTLKIRSGYTRTVSLPNAHSLWANARVMLCIAPNSQKEALYRIDGGTATLVSEVDGTRSPTSYCEWNNLVYISNQHWCGVYNVETRTLGTWGVTLPKLPKISVIEGEFPPGRYSICYTGQSDGRIGGN